MNTLTKVSIELTTAPLREDAHGYLINRNRKTLGEAGLHHMRRHISEFERLMLRKAYEWQRPNGCRFDIFSYPRVRGERLETGAPVFAAWRGEDDYGFDCFGHLEAICDLANMMYRPELNLFLEEAKQDFVFEVQGQGEYRLDYQPTIRPCGKHVALISFRNVEKYDPDNLSAPRWVFSA